ncbi:MAG TPA: tetratricopeptide repeat protein [Acidobacteriaceae bacterium]
MSAAHRSMLVLLGSLFACTVAQAEAATPASLEQQFQSALTEYNAARYPEAAAHLEPLAVKLPQNFEIHELLGLTYGVQSRTAEAVEQFQAAVRLKPDSAAARTNLATALLHQGKSVEAEQQCHKALELDPADYEAKHNLAEIYLASSRLADAVPLLEQAQRLRPAAYGNTYDLALAYLLTGRVAEARQQAEGLAAGQDTGERHNLLGRIDEKEGRFLEAAREYETAVRLDPSEDNLFVWASELLLHRTYEPAIQVFEHAVERYPDSPRLRIGLGMSLYSRGEYERSIASLLAASDLSPRDPRCYLFLSKAYLSSPNQAADVIERFRRYAELEPANALAQYYYAISLWKGRRLENPTVDYARVESLLKQAIALDDTLPEAHLQLGILYNEQHEYAKALPQYQRALELDRNLPDAHYRLAQYYVHAAQKDKAQDEFELYKKLQSQHQAQVDKERAEVQQFVVATTGTSSAKP